MGTWMSGTCQRGGWRNRASESGAISDIQVWRVSLDLGEMRRPKDLSMLGKHPSTESCPSQTTNLNFFFLLIFLIIWCVPGQPGQRFLRILVVPPVATTGTFLSLLGTASFAQFDGSMHVDSRTGIHRVSGPGNEQQDTS